MRQVKLYSVICVALMLALSTGCSFPDWISGSDTIVPQESLYKLFAMKETAVASTQFLKTKDDETKAEARTKYTDFQGSFNAAIGAIQTSISAGESSENYKDSLTKINSDVQGKANSIIQYASTRGAVQAGLHKGGPVALIISDVVDGVIKIWKAHKDELRQLRKDTNDQLEKQKLRNFDSL